MKFWIKLKEKFNEEKNSKTFFYAIFLMGHLFILYFVSDYDYDNNFQYLPNADPWGLSFMFFIVILHLTNKDNASFLRIAFLFFLNSILVLIALISIEISFYKMNSFGFLLIFYGLFYLEIQFPFVRTLLNRETVL